MSASERILRVAVPLVFGRRPLLLALLGLVTLYLGYHATHIRVDAGFEKSIPLNHPYMETFRRYQEAFGGANLISVALIRRDGDIYDGRFLAQLKQLTDAVFFLPGVDRSRVTSLFTPGVRYIEVTEDGIAAGDVMPADYRPTPEMLARIRSNVARAGIIGRIVSVDQRGALIAAELLEFHPVTHQRLDYRHVAAQLERIRKSVSSPLRYELRLKRDHAPLRAGELLAVRYSPPGLLQRLLPVRGDQPLADGSLPQVWGSALTVNAVPNPDYDPDISVHVIGFAKVVGDVTDHTLEVVGFFAVTLLLTLLMLWAYCGSFRLSLLPLNSALIAVIWEFGLMRLLGYGLDPFAILVPFLVLSIGVSHGVQMINAWAGEVGERGLNSHDAAVACFRRLAIPGTLALLTDVIGFATIYIIDIGIIREMAVNACLGMAAIIVTNKLMIPVLLSYTRLRDIEGFHARQTARTRLGNRLWDFLAGCTAPRAATVILAISTALAAWGLWQYPKLRIGEFKPGVPELRADGRYNRDSAAIVDSFRIGVDVLKVVAEGEAEACIRHAVMETIDRYAWHIENTPGVLSVASLPQIAKQISAGWNEGSLKWRVLPRNQYALVQAIGPVPSSFGLRNPDCSAMPVLIFTADHRAETIEGIVAATKDFTAASPDAPVRFALASGNVGVMAATNEVVRAKDKPIVLWVYAAIVFFVWLSFRSGISIVCIILPLALTSLLTYAFMATVDIGLKVATLPVVALGAGIGVDDGIYLFSVFGERLKAGDEVRQAWLRTLQSTGKAAIFTSVALAVSVSSWLLSGLQFQADMGLLLLFMFVVNLLGAIVMLPALASVLLRSRAAAAML